MCRRHPGSAHARHHRKLLRAGPRAPRLRLTPNVVDIVAARTPKPDLIVTVDNGISSAAAVDRARELGIDVIITDHHLPGAELPRAQAIVNPNLTGSTFPSKNLAGVGVIYYVLLALRSLLRERRHL